MVHCVMEPFDWGSPSLARLKHRRGLGGAAKGTEFAQVFALDMMWAVERQSAPHGSNTPPIEGALSAKCCHRACAQLGQHLTPPAPATTAPHRDTSANARSSSRARPSSRPPEFPGTPVIHPTGVYTRLESISVHTTRPLLASSRNGRRGLHLRRNGYGLGHSSDSREIERAAPSGRRRPVKTVLEPLVVTTGFWIDTSASGRRTTPGPYTDSAFPSQSEEPRLK